MWVMMLTHARPPGWPSWQPVILLLLGTLHFIAANIPPKFENFPTAIFPPEDKPIGSVLATLSASDPDDSTLQFALIGDIANDLLTLTKTGPKSANVVLASSLDRELVSQYTVLCQVSDRANNVIQQYMVIYVVDVNDNAPSFVNLPYRAFIPEDSPLDTFVFRVSATDPDYGLGGLVSYNITTKDGLFNINTNTGNITLSQPLDYETEKFYQLEIMAIDGGGLNSTTDLIINVEDVQDTAPFFLNLPYVAEVHENASIGTQILRVVALDGDRGIPNPVNYSFSSGDTDLFHINASTGWITVRETLDREDPNILSKLGALELKILAQEDTPTPQGPTTAKAPVSIRILDINDQVPTFEQSSYAATIPENTLQRVPVTMLPIGTEIIVRDMDEGDNGRFELFLEQNGLPFSIFDVYPTTVLNEAQVLIRVKNSSALDYETTQGFTFEIVAREYLTAELHENRTEVTVYLEDMNDNWPEFEQDFYNASIYENSQKGTSVITITATDRDSGDYGKITYALRGASSKLFAVNPTSGAITVNVHADQDLTLLDRERVDEHYLNLEAKDGGGLRTLIQIAIKLLDVNDNAPEILRPSYEGFVSENAAKLDRALDIDATDADLPPNSVITFSIDSGDPLNNFTIDANTGRIFVQNPLDYEAMDPAMEGAFNLRIRAADRGTPSLYSFTNVTIFVQDLNDETPYFSPTGYTATIPENTTGGTSVTQVFSYDMDGTAPNNEVIYRIESGAQDKFRINPTTGVLIVEYGADLDRDKFPHSYTLSVMAIDRGTPPRTGTGTVSITITDVNNKAPQFNPDRRSTRVSEGAPVGTIFFGYEAYDPDVTAYLEYSLVENEVYGWTEKGQEYTDKNYLKSLFGVHPTNGSVYVKSPLDRETVEEVQIMIFVEDLNAEQPPVQNATAILMIVLDDINDNPPHFTPSSYYTARVSEAAKPGTEVVRVVAVDYDKNPGPIQYLMVYDTNASLAFEITDHNRQTGIVTLSRPVDYEETAWINITIIANDMGSPSLTSQAWVYVEIEDVNDNSPEWTDFTSPVKVWENASLFTDVTQVHAVDRDSGEFGRVMYYIAAEDRAAPFIINNETGLLSTSALLDRETVPSYDITIEARDNNFAPPTQQRVMPGYMQIILLDVNDNHPQFELPFYQATTLENANLNHIFANIRATDADDGINAQIEYSIDFARSNSSDYFDIHLGTGAVFVRNSLQGKMGNYLVVVVATDKGVPALSNSTMLYVTVQDVNDHPPQIIFPPVNYTISIMENVPSGYHVIQVIADDKDEGINGEVEFEFVESLGNSDWKFFRIDRYSGNVTTYGSIDREEQEYYFVEIRAYDLGTPMYEDRRILTIRALDEDDNPPQFNRDEYPPPYKVSVKEEQSQVFVANLDIAYDPDAGENAKICYYIIGGDRPYMEQFYMNKTTGDLWLMQKLDREKIPVVNLTVKATESCASEHWERAENRYAHWNESDLTLLWVEVKVIDINDNAPRFTRSWFTAGVTRDTQYGAAVINLADYAHDPDEGDNAAMTFYISTPFRISSPLENDLQGKVPFTLDPVEGIIRTNVYFQELWQGYVEFGVSVNDSIPSHVSHANVSIYLLSENQRVKVIIRGDPDYVGSFRDTFAEFVSNITGTIINVDTIRTHKDNNGNPDGRRTDMFIHAINPNTGEVLASSVLIDLIDKNYAHLVDLFNKYNVIEVVPSVEVASASTLDQDLLLALIVTAIVLGLLIIIIASTFIFCRRKYKRKLKAATAMAFGSHDNGLNRLEMPNTNLHTYEGSNPIWLEQYENGWPQDSDTDSKNSLDENAVETVAKTRGFDEQEASMRMYNDEFDHYNKMPLPKHQDGDVILKAALQEHDKSTKTGKGRNMENGNSVSNGDAKKDDSSNSNGDIPHVYHNRGFQLQATEI